MVSVGDSLIQC